MTQDLFFKIVTIKVRKICESFDCTCLSNRETSTIKVFGRLTIDGRPILTAILLQSVSAICGIDLNTISIDTDGRLYALFVVKEFTDGNSD